MPVSSYSRDSTPYTASTTTATPPRFHPSQPTSPTISYAPTVTSLGQALRMNVVSRIAIEGKAKQGQDGASIKVYMKLSVPVDSVTPGSTVALFPEENIKILTSQVHPLDSSSVPYNFSSTTSPLLHNAARALSLPARSSMTFNATYHISSTPSTASSTTSSSRSSVSESASLPPVDLQYTGQILVSGYHIAYVLPKYFPGRDYGRLEAEPDRFGTPLHQKRRLSINDRNHVHFMAAVDMWVPYTNRPPRFPYLLSIPTPRCLHNNIRLRIFPPSNTASSFASLSSLEDDANSWDLTSDPHVTRTSSNRLARTGSYTHFADDESSDSSTAGFSDGYGIQGTFPSTDRIRIRWAKPQKVFDGAAGTRDSRRKVGVANVKGEMTCIIRGRRRAKEDSEVQGLVMDIEYNASCKGIWFPGVATLVGMDIGLEAKNSDVVWLKGSQSEWSVDGGVGYTGVNIVDQDHPNIETDQKNFSVDSSQASIASKIPLPSASASSLLRAPLPSHNIVEYSFEGSRDPAVSASSQLGTLSSVSGLSQSGATCSPEAPLTLHLNINDILPPNKNPFTFTIKGTVIVTPRSAPPRVNGMGHSMQDYDETTEPIYVPQFVVWAADVETTKILIKNDVDQLNATVEVYGPSGDMHKDPQIRKTVLQRGGSTLCGDGGARLVLKVISSLRDRINPARTQTPTGSPQDRASANMIRQSITGRQLFDGPSLISSIKAVVTPLISRNFSVPDAYAVRINVNARIKDGANWLEFGLARIDPGFSSTSSGKSPVIRITGVNVDGVPAHYEVTETERQGSNSIDTATASFEAVGGMEWVNWVKILIPANGDNVAIDYVVKLEPPRSTWISNRSHLTMEFLEIRLESLTGFNFSINDSNLLYQHSNSDRKTLLHFGQRELFSPRISLDLRRDESNNQHPRWSWLANLLWWCCFFVALLFTQNPSLRIIPSSMTPEVSVPMAISVLDDTHTLVTTIVTTTITTATCSSNTLEPVAPSSERPKTFEGSVSTPLPMPTVATTPLSISPLSTASLSTVSLSTTSLSTAFLSTASSSTQLAEPTSSSTVAPIPYAISAETINSLWEKLGFDDIEASLKSITLPDIQLPFVKEKLSQLGRIIWDLILGPEPGS
ncbi:hypothetical protein AGABI2DRAFT_183107 [Agaricus bisporus var. bisporus H97]|uniref:hypothetical protein n=1 Tax=Agaricus bisporus var. bisporus (strain H97 / ATCC MYA-4626 / FGSC 10389) TaxID=936046 RepID=UPI00029F555E|nr:hypothetical protein AGABI2DRAFT_183107 [Agaricus bisporus var. bisporus H97]EKV49954.1 hypothetical protein AGABI2DRAFT_183107 [Agaricus bisporus var. bisporus H97]